MKRLAEGQTTAFERLVDRYQDRLILYFTHMSGDRATGEDLAQEVFIRLYRYRAAYRPRASFLTFLYHVAKNVWIDHYRHKKSEGATLSWESGDCEGRTLGETLAAAPSPPQVETSRTRILAAALQKLPHTQREPLLLAQVGDMRHEDIARVLDIPIGTVKSRIHHAIRKLRAILTRQGLTGAHAGSETP